MPSLRRRDRREEEERELAQPASALPEHAVLALQRASGNRAVSQVLARDPNPALERAPTARPPKPKLRTGREVDAIFDTSPYFKDLVGAKMQKITLAKAMKVDDEDAFATAWSEYAQRSFNPDTNANYTPEEAARYLATKGVRAFQDEDRGEVHIRKARADLGTQLHEGLHLYSDDGWKRHMGYAANEGVTEWFTRKLGPEVGVERDDSSFLREYTSVTHLLEVINESTLATAYFGGDVKALQAKLDERKGKGTWKQWLAFLDANDFKGANKLMREAADSKP